MPAARVFTGLSVDPALPYATVSKESEHAGDYYNDGSQTAVVGLRIKVFHGQYDAGAAVMLQVKAAFDSTARFRWPAATRWSTCGASTTPNGRVKTACGSSSAISSVRSTWPQAVENNNFPPLLQKRKEPLMTFVAELKASMSWTWDDGAVDDDRLDCLQQFSDGNGDGEAEAVWHLEEQVLPAGQSVALDLTALEREIPRRPQHDCDGDGEGPVGEQRRGERGQPSGGRRGGHPWSPPFAAPADQAVVAPDGLLF